MSVFRRYNEDTKRWEPVASADATTIVSGNPSITPEGTTESLEDILVRDRQDIELLKKNVSWLAKHGGGGGFGGGGVASKAEVQILSPLDNTTPTTNIIWKPGIATIACKIVSSYIGTYNITVRINGKNVYSVAGVKRNSIVNIPTSVLGIGNNSVTMQVLAYDESEMEYTGECKISIASVELQKPTAVTVTQNQLLNSTPSLILTYRTTIPGNYRMYYSDTMISYDANLGWRDAAGALDDSTNNRSQYVDMLNVGTTVSNLGIQLTDVYGDGNTALISKQAAPGVYARYFVMVSATDPTICSSVQAAQINVTVTNGLLVSPQFGIDEKSPYSISLDSVLDLRFITYSKNAGTYSYSVWYGDKQISEVRSGNIYGTMVTEKISVASIVDKEGIYKLTIKANGLGSNAESDVYIRVTRALAELLYAYRQDINEFNIFDFTIWDNMSNIENSATCVNNKFRYLSTGKYGELKQNINFYNKGIDSGSTKVYYKMHHTCVGKIDSNGKQWFPKNANDTDSLIPGASYQFTLSLAYRIGQEVDDNATVFYLGDYDPVTLGGTGKGAGILVTAHGYYIRIEGTTIEGVLSDNDFTQFDVVMTLGNGALQGYTMLYIYQNGILLQATQVQINTNQDYSLYAFKQALIGCRTMTDMGSYYDTTNSINMDLYSVKMFSAPLNDGQIVCNNINNYANFKRMTGDNSLDPTLISRLLTNNSILADADVPAQLDELGKEMIDENGQKVYDTSKISSLFDMQAGTYNWGVSVSGNDIVLGSNLQGIPIPIVTVSGLTWRYSDFTSTSAKLESTPGKLRYLDGNKTPIECVVKVDPQGTTTLIYNVKNIDITFENCLFSPKESWFPEQTFTLKADIVDSGHLNNAVIGTFVNDCLNNTTLINKDAFPVQSIIEENKRSNGKMMPDKMNLKATIEGFPVLLVLDFVSESGDARDPRVMGIYSFNLGRKSYHNQGFEVLKCLRSVSGEMLNPDAISFPSLFGMPQSSDKDMTYQAYCFEGTRSFNNSVTMDDEIDINSNSNYDYATVVVNQSTGRKIWLPSVVESGGYVKYNDKTLYDDDGNTILWNNLNVKKYSIIPDGYFWSNHKSYASSLLWDLIYADNTNEAWEAFEVLNRCVAEKLQYTKGSSIRAYNTSLDQYEIVSAEGESLERKKVPGTKFNLTFPQAKEPIEVSVKNSAFYFVVCMLFGLVDNFGKNMQMKHWTTGSNQPRWSPTFYDMDTALGIDNTGGQTILPTVFDESIINTPENKAAFMFASAPQSSNGLFTVYSNKLFGGIDNMTFQKQYNPDYGSEEEYQVFAKMWSDLRTSKLTHIEEFVDNYLHTQLHDCGEFMYNYDYNVKYLSTSQIHMLHGNRLSFIKNWLTERISFLDSVFGYKYGNANESKYLTETAASSAPYITPYNVSWKNQVDIIHNSASLNLPVITNKSIIMRTNIGNKSISYVYVPKNTKTNIPVADSLNTANIQTWINNSDCIIDIDLQNIDVTNLVHQNGTPVTNIDNSIHYLGKEALSNIYYQIGSFASLKNLDLRNCNLTAALDFFKLFKTWDSSPYGIEPEAFSLQTLNLSGVKTPNLTANLTGEVSQDEAIPKIYKAPFTNITSVDVSDSNIASINIPDGVSLYNLNIRNSNIQTLTLRDQPLLSAPSFNGCQNLSTVSIINCNRFVNLEFDSTVQTLKRLDITGCMNLETLTIDATGYKYIPEITIENCPKLREITISKLEVDNDENSSRKLILSGVDNLQSIELSKSVLESIEWDGIYEENGEIKGMTKLHTLDLSNSNIKRIYNRKTGKFADKNVIDLIGFDSDTLTTIKFTDNKQVTAAYFSNIEDKPFVLKTSNIFSRCESLARVYGNIHLWANRAFSESKKFSIHGTSGPKFNGMSVLDESGHVWLHPMDLGILTEDGVIWQEGENVTNIRLIGNSLEAFRKTSCTTFDAYYILQNLSNVKKTFDGTVVCDKVTNISYLFGGSGVVFDWGKDKNTEIEYDNSPHRYIFSRCGVVTNVNGLFEGSISGSGCRLHSPYFDSAANEVIPGIFTPLKSVSYMSNIFSNMASVVVDRNLLRCIDENAPKYKLKQIIRFSPGIVVNDVRDVNYSIAKAIMEDPIGNGDLHGDLSGFFKDCPKLEDELVNVLDSILYIDFDNFKKEGLGLAPDIKSLTNSITCQWGRGNLVLDELFDGPENIEHIYSSIRVTSYENGVSVTMNINNETFSKFVNLINVGYHETGDYKATINENSFSGAGLIKKIDDNSFPYGMLRNNKKLKSFVGFFKDCDATIVSNAEYIDLPGGLFSNNPEIENISYSFYNIKTGLPYRLSADAPFSNNHKLSNVSYLFGHDVNKDSGKSCLRETNIPARLFYHGESVTNKVIIGTNYTYEVDIVEIKSSSAGSVAVQNISEIVVGSEKTKVTYEYLNYVKLEDDSKVLVTPATTISKVTTISQISNGIEIITSSKSDIIEMEGLQDNTKTYNFTYSLLNNSITNMKGCFMGADIRAYSCEWNESDIPESNSEYQPFDYAYEGGRWKAVTRNDNRYTYMWKYDGDRKRYLDHINKTTVKNNIEKVYPTISGYNYLMYLPDDAFDGTYDCLETINADCVKNSKAIGGSANGDINNCCGDAGERFCTPPDLFRYCKPNAIISEIFKNCGLASHSLAMADRDNVFDTGATDNERAYGLKGRLCPYLLKPLTELGDLSNAFYACSFIGGYMKNERVYMIPESFFAWVNSSSLNLKNTFALWIWPLYSSLNVFKFGRSMQLNVESAFEHPLFTYFPFDSDTEADRNSRTAISNVFSNENIYVRGMQQCFALDTNIKSTVFQSDQPVTFSNMFNRYDKNISTSDKYVFCGYDLLGNDASKNDRFGIKTLRTDSAYHNYDVRIKKEE